MSCPPPRNNESNGLWKQCYFKPLASGSTSWAQICASAAIQQRLQHLLLSRKKKKGETTLLSPRQSHSFWQAGTLQTLLEGFQSCCKASDVFLWSSVLLRHIKPSYSSLVSLIIPSEFCQKKTENSPLVFNSASASFMVIDRRESHLKPSAFAFPAPLMMGWKDMQFSLKAKKWKQDLDPTTVDICHFYQICHFFGPVFIPNVILGTDAFLHLNTDHVKSTKNAGNRMIKANSLCTKEEMPLKASESFSLSC